MPKIEMGKKYVTKEEKFPVRILCVDQKYIGRPVVGLMDEGSRESLLSWDEEGRYSQTWPHRLDLITAPRIVYVNIWEDKVGLLRFLVCTDELPIGGENLGKLLIKAHPITLPE